MSFEEFKDAVQAMWADLDAYVEDVAIAFPVEKGVRLVTIGSPEQPRPAAMAVALHALQAMDPKMFSIIRPNGTFSREIAFITGNQKEYSLLALIMSGGQGGKPHWSTPDSVPGIAAAIREALAANEALAKRSKFLAGLGKEVPA